MVPVGVGAPWCRVALSVSDADTCFVLDADDLGCEVCVGEGVVDEGTEDECNDCAGGRDGVLGVVGGGTAAGRVGMEGEGVGCGADGRGTGGRGGGGRGATV